MAYTTIKKPSDYFNTKLYAGTDSAQSETGVGFQPDFTWIKVRNYGGSASFEHVLTDAVRGANKTLTSDSTEAETINNATGYLSSFDSDGFSLAAGATSIDAVAGGGRNYVAWNWLGANGTASNTDGSITSTVSANTTSGFSIVSYTGNGVSGATIGHGLGVTPKIIIVKNRTGTTNPWWVYASTIGAGGQLRLNETNAQGSDGGVIWNSTEPTSSVFSVGDNGGSNGSGNPIIAYCFAEVKGFSKFGSYVGNGSTNGTFVYCGFKPAWVMVKRTGIASWFIKDNKRDPFNPAEQTLAPDSTSSEAGWGTGDDIDLLSNGFKMKDNTTSTNLAGNTYIYMAFAEEPLVGDNPATAR